MQHSSNLNIEPVATKAPHCTIVNANVNSIIVVIDTNIVVQVKLTIINSIAIGILMVVSAIVGNMCIAGPLSSSSS